MLLIIALPVPSRKLLFVIYLKMITHCVRVCTTTRDVARIVRDFRAHRTGCFAVTREEKE
jgi:hypothetical protein